MEIHDANPDRAVAVSLLAEHRTEIAQAIVRLARRLEPRWTSVPQAVAEASAATQLRAIERFLRTGDGGFGVADFAIKSHAYLPVIRRDEEEDTVPGARAGVVRSFNPFTMVAVDAEL